MINIKKYTLSTTATIRDALKKIDQNMLGCVFLVDAKNKLKGIVTDGDIRRAFLKGATIKSPVKVAANSKPVFVYVNTSPEKTQAALSNKKIKILPILDRTKTVVDFIKYDQSVYFPVAQPVFEGNELRYVTDAVLSGWVSSAGSYITRFENEFAKFCKTKYAVACSNGTTALHLALLALGIGPGDEVIVPSLTFIATANAVRYVGATPVLVDVEPEYWQIDPASIEAAITKKTKAIIPVHLYGHPAKMDVIKKIAKKHKIFIIEDAAEAIGAEVYKQKVGSWGDLGIFSFYGNKIITTGEGGMVTTNNKKLAESLRVLRDHGMAKNRRYYHEVLGYNYRMTNIQAALGLAQLERIEQILKKKIKIADWYNQNLQNIPALSLQKEASWAKNVYWMFCILVDEKKLGFSRDTLIAKLKEVGVDTRPFFIPIHSQPIYGEHRALPLPHSHHLGKIGINLPSSVSLTQNDIAVIAKKIKQLL